MNALVFLFIFFAGAASAQANECAQVEDQILCRSGAPTPVSNRSQLRELSQELSFSSEQRPELLCRMGIANSKKDLKEVVNFEASRLAPLLQKIQSVRESRKLANGRDSSELDKLERTIKKTSLLSYSDQSDETSAILQKDGIWNPNKLTPPLKKQVQSTTADLESRSFPDTLLREIAFAQNVPENCSRDNSKLAYLKSSAKSDSPQMYHFKKTLLQDSSLVEVQGAVQACSPAKENIPKICTLSAEEKRQTAEQEYNAQVCALKKIFPVAAAALGKLSLEIPSVGGDLVTEGLGEKPTIEEAKSKNFQWNFLCPEDLSAGGILRGIAGFGASLLTHEVSHEVAGKVSGNDLKWNMNSGTWSCQNCSEHIKPIAMAGLLSHSVGSEVIVNTQSNDSQFQKGWLFSNVLNTSGYFVKDWLARAGKVKGQGYATGVADTKGSGDLRAFSNKESYLLGTAMIGHQLYSGYRYLKNRQDYQCKK
ncbi:MAG: hypothetical protein H7326_11780 [Bdellovibrionaceae bacterium]|nr:hypothetical protein [Pseudobdellovibrionaceae bacterium]